MSKKQKLLIFSQCHIYGGSERLMQSIYKNDKISEVYDIVFAYSYFKDYKNGLLRDNANQITNTKFQPLYLATNGNVFYKINLIFKNKLLRKLFKIPFYLPEFIGLFSLWNYTYLYLYILFNKPDVLHINNGGYPAAKACNQLAKIILLFNDTRVIYQVNNKPKLILSSFDKLLDIIIQKSVDLFLTHSIQNKNALIERGFNSKKVVSIPSFFEETILEELNTEILMKDKKYSLAMVGFLSFRKGQLFLLKALTLLREIDPVFFSKIQLNLIGDGDAIFEIADYIKTNQLEDNVILWGARADYINFIKDCDVFMLTSIEGEDLPLVLLSAMQLNKCIVASKFAGIADLLTNDFDSILVTPNSETLSKEIAEVLYDLLQNEYKREQLSSNVNKTYNEKLGKDNYSKCLLAFYKTNYVNEIK